MENDFKFAIFVFISFKKQIINLFRYPFVLCHNCTEDKKRQNV